jgi:Protein of unknown function (DUF3307)
MFKEYFTLLLLTHILGDFYFQTNNIAKKKAASIKWVIMHCFCYMVTAIVILVSMYSMKMFWSAAAIAGIHAVIDIAKYDYLKRKNSPHNFKKERTVFFTDQIIHVVTLIGVAYICTVYFGEMNINESIEHFFSIIGVPVWPVICWCSALLLIHKPANLVITKLLSVYRPESKDNEKNDKNAGRFIGTLERMIMLIFISINQYAAIGLVLTAKSIARYDKISQEKDFAEYYLLGTLLSTVIVLVISFIVR